MRNQTKRKLVKVHKLITKGIPTATALKRTHTTWATWTKYKNSFDDTTADEAMYTEDSDNIRSIVRTIVTLKQLTDTNKITIIREILR